MSAVSHAKNTKITLERRVAELYDFSLDITRHENDMQFASEGGKIHYVMDENIFEMFIEPYENFSYVVRDGEISRGGGYAVQRRRRRAIDSAMLTAETILSGTLPGQSGGQFFLTEWHRSELMGRVSDLLGELKHPQDERFRSAFEQVLSAKEDILNDGYNQAGSIVGQKAGAEAEQGADAARRIVRLRAATRTLATDDIVEPMHQLIRVLKDDEAGRFRSLAEVMTPSLGEVAALQRSASRWSSLIMNEARARAAYFQTPINRSSGATWNDGQSLALIEWISRTLDPATERLVFITGDETLFDAYRRYYERDRHGRQAPSTPFVLRRPLQYTALFSRRNGSLNQSLEQLFYSLQQLVELPLTPLRVETIADASLPDEVMYRRHSLTLRRLDSANRESYFRTAWKAYGHGYLEAEVDAVEEQIEYNELLLNSLSTQVLERRISPSERKLLQEVRVGSHEERVRIVANYVDEAVTTMLAAAVDLWRPKAEEFFRKAALRPESPGSRRVPIAMNLWLEPGEMPSALSLLLDALLGDQIEDGFSGTGPVLPITSLFEIFLGSAAVALHGNYWRLAEHFCDIAINAFQHFARIENTSEHEAAEVYYLSALARRFRLGTLQPRPAVVRQASKIYDNAIQLLNRSEELAGSPGTGFAAYRAYSEKAAVSLFLATFCAKASIVRNSEMRHEKIREAGAQAFTNAGSYLREALRIERQSGFADISPIVNGAPLERLRSQILINITAWFALVPEFEHSLLQREGTELSREGIRALPLLERALAKEGMSLFSGELLAFRISQNIDRERSRAELRQLLRRLPKLDLELDRAFYDLLESNWARD